jgi:hypothetical protein
MIVAAIHAQQAKTPPGYVIAEVELTHPTTLLCKLSSTVPNSRSQASSGMIMPKTLHRNVQIVERPLTHTSAVDTQRVLTFVTPSWAIVSSFRSRLSLSLKSRS